MKEENAKLRDIRIAKILGMKDDGRHLQIRCPFHNDRTPSCVIYPENTYHCFGCNAHGQGAIDFVMGLGYSFKEAIEYLKGLDL